MTFIKSDNVCVEPSKKMDQQLVNDFVAVLLKTRIKELKDECKQLRGRVDELKSAHERKTDEIARLRQTIKNERHLKQSALSKLAQIEVVGASASVVSTVDHWLTTAANLAGCDKDSESGVVSSDDGSAASGSIGGTVDHDFQRRLLELELQLVSKERENLTKHKVIIDHFENVLQTKRRKIEEKEKEIRRMRAELAQKQSMIDQLRLEHGFAARIGPSPSSSAVSAMSSKEVGS